MVVYIFIFSGKWEGNVLYRVKNWGIAFVLFLLFSSFCKIANCKGDSVKTHLTSNQFISKSHQIQLLNDIQRYETSTEMQKESASLMELGGS